MPDIIVSTHVVATIENGERSKLPCGHEMTYIDANGKRCCATCEPMRSKLVPWADYARKSDA